MAPEEHRSEGCLLQGFEIVQFLKKLALLINFLLSHAKPLSYTLVQPRTLSTLNPGRICSTTCINQIISQTLGD